MKLAVYCFVALLTSLIAAGSFADEIGRATIEGRTVIVDSNGTWKYAEAAVDANGQAQIDCTKGTVTKSKKLAVSLCVTPPWTLDSGASGLMELQVVNKDLDIYFGLVTERTTMPLAGIRRAILYNAAQATAVREEDIVIAKESTEKIGGHEWSYIEYDVTFNGAKFRFANYYSSLGDLGIIQSVFWCSASYFEQNRAVMSDFMKGIAFQDSN